MVELWDVYDKNRKKTGKVVQRGSNELGYGEYHLVVQGFILNSKNEILISKRSKNKKFGLMWECNGGSAVQGETSLDGIIRELNEELGLLFTKKEAMFLKVEVREKLPPDFKDIWVFRTDAQISDLKYQEDEVVDAKWVTFEEFKKMQENKEIVPTNDIDESDYYKAIGLKQRESYLYIGRTLKVKVDRPMNSLHPKYKFEYPVNYGFIPNTISADGEELDCYILGVDEPLQEFEGDCIAVIHRTNDDDDKLIIVPKGKNITDEEIKSETDFQEKYFESEIIR